MKKILFIILLIISMFTFNLTVYAECNNEELNNWAENLDIKFQKVENEEYPFSYLLMLNVPRNDLVVKAKDTYSNGTYNVEYDDEFKNYVIGSEVHFIDKEYTITVSMASNATTCSGETMKTITYVVPEYNEYNDTVYCEDNPDADICGAYTRVDEDAKDKADDIVNNYYEEELNKDIDLGKPWYKKVWEVIAEYSLYVLIPLVALSAIYGVIIWIEKRKKQVKF